MTRIQTLIRGGVFVAAAGLASPALAQGSEEQRIGEQTRAWVDLQASGTQASTAERPMTGELAERVYQRYLDSFTHPIPEQFQREAFTSDGEN